MRIVSASYVAFWISSFVIAAVVVVFSDEDDDLL